MENSNQNRTITEKSKNGVMLSSVNQSNKAMSTAKKIRRGRHQTILYLILFKTVKAWDRYINFTGNGLISRSKWLSEPADSHMGALCKEVNQRIKLHLWKYIKEFKLDFQKSQVHEISQNMFKAIGVKLLKNLRHLKTLRLTFTRWADHLDFAHFYSLVQQIVPFLRGLKNLTLDFMECHRINDACLAVLMKEMGNYCRDLNKLSLHFSKSNFITDAGIKRVGKSIGRILPRLQELTIKFQGCRVISERGVADFIKHIGAKLRDLVNLTLDFSRCDGITDEALKNLGKVIGAKFPKLLHLRLEFSGCQRIGTFGAGSIFTDVTTQLKRLKTLTFYFSDCVSLESDMMSNLEVNVKANLTKLKRFSLDLSGCPSIKSKEKIGLQKKLNALEGLEAGVF